jgi:beta-glucanase (GH16 family)
MYEYFNNIFKFMKTFIIFVIGCCLLSFSNNHKPDGLIWSDEFNYTGSPDSTKWNYETGDGCPDRCGWGNNEAQIYTKDLKNVRVENGSLIIDALKTGTQWTSGRITSEAKMNFTYGRIEFRAKLPKSLGSWSALWMLGENYKTKGWPACGEIDVMEHVGRNPGVVQSVLHTPDSYGATVNLKSHNVNSFDSDFHVYEANWTINKIEFSVDGVNFYTFEPINRNSKSWPFDSPFYIIMNIAMGGNLGGPAIDPAITVARMEVDYVRVYQ